MPDHRNSPLSEPYPGRRTARRRRASLAVLATLVAVASTPGVAVAATDQAVAEARTRAVDWLRSQQRADGSMGEVQGLDAGWSLLGLAGSGVHAAELHPGGNPAAPSAQEFYVGLWGGGNDLAFASNPSTIQASDYVRATLIANAAGVDPQRVTPTQNLTAKLARHWFDGRFQAPGPVTFYNQRVFGLLALARAPVPEAFRARTAALIEAGQFADGSYPVGVDMTGASIAGLCASGRTLDTPSVSRAVTDLRSRRNAVTGAIGNVNSTSWALQGLGACGLHRGAAEWTSDDERTIDWLLAGQRADGSWAMSGNPSDGSNAYATQDALRALAPRPGLVVDPPERAGGGPVVRPVAAVAAGTPISVALAIDAGFDELKLCEVPTVAGATLRELLQAARGAATPAGCVSAPRWDAGALSALNGRRTATPTGGWRWSVDGGTTEAAATDARTVSAGDVVSLRLVDPSSDVVPPDPDDPDPDPPTPEPPVDRDPPVDPPFFPPAGDQPPPLRPIVPAPRTTPVERTTVRTACRRTSRNRAVTCTVRASGRFTVTATLPGRKAVRKTASKRVVTVVRAPRALRSTQRIRLRISVGKRSRTITVRANGRTVTSRI